ncbi:MAG: hypothetical protein FWB77_05420 [Treponema sp.]|nr:hypothetical protein [Treponema sp.]
MIKKYLLYLGRWQLSTPILAVVLILMSNFNPTIATIVANLIGGLIFFWIDKIIFRVAAKEPLWEIKDNTVCADCGKVGRSYRVVEWRGYNRRNVKNPQFRCETCREIKLSKLNVSKT